MKAKRFFLVCLFSSLSSLVSPVASAQELQVGLERSLGGASVRAALYLGDPGPGYRLTYCRPRHGASDRYRTVARRVWVPGTVERIWIDPVYETRYDACGRPVRILICEGTWKDIERPGHYEIRYVRVWTPTRWSSCP